MYTSEGNNQTEYNKHSETNLKFDVQRCVRVCHGRKLKSRWNGDV